jgi:predicted enzyme related to lactoylglutathione lyase
MITGVHALFYATDAEQVRAFLRDVLGLRFVETGSPGEPWPIFALPPAELGVHPHDDVHHELYLMCDDITSTMADLRAKGAAFEGGVEDRGWGLVAVMRVPGGGSLGLYEPRHATAT